MIYLNLAEPCGLKRTSYVFDVSNGLQDHLSVYLTTVQPQFRTDVNDDCWRAADGLWDRRFSVNPPPTIPAAARDRLHQLLTVGVRYEF